MQRLMMWMLAVAVGGGLLGCDDNGGGPFSGGRTLIEEHPSRAQPVDVVLLEFDERRGDAAAPSTTRALVGERYMRLDTGPEAPEYLLFDRQTGAIHAVSGDDEAILTIARRAVEMEPPVPLEVEISRERVTVDSPLNEPAGESYQFRVNDRVCYEATVVPGQLEQIRRVMAEYRRTMAGEQAATYGADLADELTACDLYNHIFGATEPLHYGFPVAESAITGYERRLVKVDESFTVDREVFELPEGYQRYDSQELRGRFGG